MKKKTAGGIWFLPFRCGILCGCFLVLFLMFSNIYRSDLPNKTPVLHQQIYNEPSAKIASKSYRPVPLFSYGYRSEVHVCWFLNSIHRFSQLCSLLSVKILFYIQRCSCGCRPHFLSLSFMNRVDESTLQALTTQSRNRIVVIFLVVHAILIVGYNMVSSIN